jgi:probable HAF family extracellular repeat protein
VINLGNPLGGTASAAQGLNNRGWADGDSSLTGDATEHAVLWRNGKMTDLGTLGGLNSSGGPVTDKGLIAGWAQTSTVDPLGENWGLEFGCTPSGGSCQGYQNLVLGFLWKNDVMTALPTLGGNNSLTSFTHGANSRGQIVGLAENASQDPTCVAPQVFDWEAVIWGPRVGEIHELPPFAGDSVGAAWGINDNGQAVGGSGICAFPSTVDSVHAVLWQDRSVTDLGSFGGAMNNLAFAINNRGQVVGQSDLPGDATEHAFLWTKENGMQDLGTLPGDLSSVAYGINNEGQVVLQSCDVNFNCRVALWQDGVMMDLNTLPPQAPCMWSVHSPSMIAARSRAGAVPPRMGPVPVNSSVSWRSLAMAKATARPAHHQARRSFCPTTFASSFGNDTASAASEPG